MPLVGLASHVTSTYGPYLNDIQVFASLVELQKECRYAAERGVVRVTISNQSITR